MIAVSRRYFINTTGMIRVAFADPFGGEDSALQRTVGLDGLKGVLRAARIESAGRATQGAEHRLIEPDYADHHFLHAYSLELCRRFIAGTRHALLADTVNAILSSHRQPPGPRVCQTVYPGPAATIGQTDC